ncbi:MAG TPA: nitroreductase family deazaflavin-dependent oxidoreductase [Candidatus Limnocylindrales bacterium]|nr:nitroreductase family deazaflavin-dependent oxidoreductase [Candidatus Limnocylindrales bacterium]
MPMPLWLGRFNTRYTNRIIGPMLVWLPWFGWLFHVGRTTGRPYRTPLMLFRRGDRGVIALTYGERTQWLKNVLAAGECTFQSPRSHPIHLASPEFLHDPSRRLVPWVIRLPLWVIRVSDFVVFRVVP